MADGERTLSKLLQRLSRSPGSTIRQLGVAWKLPTGLRTVQNDSVHDFVVLNQLIYYRLITASIPGHSTGATFDVLRAVRKLV